MIPILDLKVQYAALEHELNAAMREVAASCRYILGPQVETLEKDIASYCGCTFGIGVANGTDALHLALRALNIGPGDEVITTPFTFIATTEAIGIVGAKPVFVDIEPKTFNLDPAKVEAAVTARTKAILPVHLFGQPCDMESILDIAKRRGLKVIEDCAQAIGANYRGGQIGALGDMGCLSFFPSKNLGCFGDGGMVVTKDEGLAQRVDMLRRHGGRVKYHHQELGINSRLDEIQAAILRVKFAHLEDWLEARRCVAGKYREALSPLSEVVTPTEIPDVRAVYHQYTIGVPHRDHIKERLHERGVGTAIYYPVPLHLQEVHADLGHRLGDFPESEKAAATVLSLPMFPELTDQQIKTVVTALRTVLEETL